MQYSQAQNQAACCALLDVICLADVLVICQVRRVRLKSWRLLLSREKDGGTEVNLRIAYALCAQLKEFVGPVGVYGSVNDILNENMVVMKASSPACDYVALPVVVLHWGCPANTCNLWLASISIADHASMQDVHEG